MADVIATNSENSSAEEVIPPATQPFDGGEADVVITARLSQDELSAEVGGGEAGTWNQIARVGTFRGYGGGPFEITQQTLQEFFRNFYATKNQKVVVDFEHASEAEAHQLASGGAPAAAWITALEMRNNNTELWGLFEWTDPDIQAAVRAKKYRFISPAFTLKTRHRETGEQIGAYLRSAALTNNPFIDGMAEVVASLGASDTKKCADENFGSTEVTVDSREEKRKADVEMDEETETTPPVTANIGVMDVQAPPAPPTEENEKHMSAFQVLKNVAKTCKLKFQLADTMAFEEAETAILQELQFLVEQLARLQEAESRQLSDRAQATVALVCASGALDANDTEAVDAAVSLCLNNRPVFDALYKKACDAGLEKLRASSETSEFDAKYPALAGVVSERSKVTASNREAVNEILKVFTATDHPRADAKDPEPPPAVTTREAEKPVKLSIHAQQSLILEAARKTAHERGISLTHAIEIEEAAMAAKDQ